MTDDLDLPTEPDHFYDNILNDITDNSKLISESSLPIEIQIAPQSLQEEDFNHLGLNELDKKVLLSELADCNLYLKNIHKGFKFARSTSSLIKLVGAGIGVHRHRRQVLKDIKQGAGDIIDIDEYGNPK